MPSILDMARWLCERVTTIRFSGRDADAAGQKLLHEAAFLLVEGGALMAQEVEFGVGGGAPAEAQLLQKLDRRNLADVGFEEVGGVHGLLGGSLTRRREGAKRLICVSPVRRYGVCVS